MTDWRWTEVDTLESQDKLIEEKSLLKKIGTKIVVT